MLEAGYVFTATPKHDENRDRGIQIIADIGASAHVVPDQYLLFNFQPEKESIIEIGRTSLTSGTV